VGEKKTLEEGREREATDRDGRKRASPEGIVKKDAPWHPRIATGPGRGEMTK